MSGEAKLGLGPAGLTETCFNRFDVRRLGPGLPVVSN